ISRSGGSAHLAHADLSEPAQVASLFDGSAPYGPMDVLVNNAGTYPSAPLRLDADDFEPYDGVTEDSRASGHGFARRTFQLSDRFFVLFAEAGGAHAVRVGTRGRQRVARVARGRAGRLLSGTVAPARLPRRAGWFVGTSGEDEARAEGEFTTSWASTIPYADEWNVLPPFKTRTRLPRDGIVIWLSLSRTNRFPPRPAGDETFPAREPPFSLDEFKRRSRVGGAGSRPSRVPAFGNGSRRVQRRPARLLRPARPHPR
ncbi:MAG: hypothetical protein ACRDM8_08290, partial [Gaiellaceae bacterium]